MDDLKYEPVEHNHKEMIEQAMKRPGFKEAYEALEEEYNIAREMLAARANAGMTQERVAEVMGTTKSTVSRLEASGKHSPSLSTLKRYAHAVGCKLVVKFIPDPKRG